ncbi:MAG: hypothetical protein HUU16_11985 [Candidatus Omnitrophica bacterium]|nr:hypothetical protein [Candidatus Omnitrophota bacterium]
MSRPTDHRNLDLAQFNLDVAFGHAHGRVLWQPRILCWFTDKRFAGEPLPERYREMTEAEIYRDLGCSNRVYDYNDCYRRVEDPRIERTEQTLSEGVIRRCVRTPVGEISAVFRKSANSWFEIQEKHWIETPEDMRVGTWIQDHTTWEWDEDRFREVLSMWGDRGAPSMYMPRVNVEHLYLETMGVERAIFALLEWEEVVEDYYRALHECHLRMIEVINRSPIRLVCFGDNLHCATLSPRLYEQWVLPAYHDRCARLHSAGKFVYSHWDGDTKALLPYARSSGLDGIEAITPKPQGDVTLEEMKEALGNEVFLLDGIPAVFFDRTYTEEELAECAERLIELFAPRLILGISDEISSTGDLERVRLVGKIVDDYNAEVPSNPGSLEGD